MPAPSAAIQPFEIAIPDAVLKDLQTRLRSTRWPDQLSDVKWDDGTDLQYLQNLCRYWHTEYDWRAEEAALNRFHHFRAVIDGVGIHFIHERSGKKVLPLLLTHGWPDNFARFRKIIPLLAADFDLIVPSIPGYGFSDKPTRRGMNPQHIATLFSKLMSELGYDRFVAHGGDWGANVTEALGVVAPERVLGAHQTDIAWKKIFTIKADDLSPEEKKFVEAGKRWQQAEGAYALIQGTKPQTLAYAMNDSPAGLAAWLIEKYRSWSDCGGDVEKRFGKDELLTFVMIPWVTQTAGSGFRIYREAMMAKDIDDAALRRVPRGVAMFPKELVSAPRAFAERFYDLRRWTDMPRGGHFGAFEEPELLANDIRAFFFDDLKLG